MRNKRVLGAMGLVIGVAHGAVWGFSVSYDQRVTSGGEVVESAVRVKDDLMRIDSSAEGERVIVAELTNIQLGAPLAESDFALPAGVEVMEDSSLMGYDDE
jgi:hypothetical protein